MFADDVSMTSCAAEPAATDAPAPTPTPAEIATVPPTPAATVPPVDQAASTGQPDTIWDSQAAPALVGALAGAVVILGALAFSRRGNHG